MLAAQKSHVCSLNQAPWRRLCGALGGGALSQLGGYTIQKMAKETCWENGKTLGKHWGNSWKKGELWDKLGEMEKGMGVDELIMIWDLAVKNMIPTMILKHETGDLAVGNVDIKYRNRDVSNII